ncbi:hypothetical protein UFOVP826_42 [uncultured Caudovirales phage]|uniref:Uncharacterized protein n=1 Tax=uncultured Caudovirales phage TaxID=2100421 RepID=A0A6J5P5S1_9CAUD|nr:hypothetical protein UFOVP826_42 [uncultured Caudovirales phage]
MDNVVPFPGLTKAWVPPEKVLDGAKEANLSEVLILGYNEDNTLHIYSSTSDIAQLLLMVKRVEKQLVSMAEDDDWDE